MADNGPILAAHSRPELPGVEIIDRIEQVRYQLQTPESVSPSPVSTEEFLFPVTEAISLETTSITLSNPVSVIVRNRDGDMVTEVEHLDSQSLPAGSYSLDLSTQIKTYIEVTGPLNINAELFGVTVEFPESQSVNIGFRSRHTRPAATITTSESPRDVMEALSQFGSALKSTSPERSFPTLRGHPPRIELGDSLDIPSELEPPDTGIEIVVPPSLEYVYPVAPLAYYLGADVVPGERPHLRTDHGTVTDFGFEKFEAAVEQTLKQTFLLDCITRTEGFYDVSLSEREQLDDVVDLNWADLYDQPIADRNHSYLDVPYERVESQVPRWRLVAHAEPTAQSVEQIPFVVDDLAVVRSVQGPTRTEPSLNVVNNKDRSSVLTRSAQTRGSHTNQQPYIQFEPTDSLEQGWIGDGVPIGASKLMTTAFENRLDRDVKTGDISITIVLNDTRMDEERDLVDDAYGDREELPFDVSVRRNLTVEELRETLQNECDFLHYIGHTDADGFECTDGKLDAAELESTGVDAFLLNACRSYHQGVALVEAGAISGIVTLADIISNEAVSVGELIAKLLNTGFPLRSALTIAREESILGGQYIVVGDGGVAVTQSVSRTPNLVDITPDGNKYKINILLFATDTAGLGTIYTPVIESLGNLYFLIPGHTGNISISEKELSHFLELDNVPVRINSELTWSSSVSFKDL
ncbi:hypothetical protein [Halovenus halobia]|uniref:hypothetical protein n=1 Tax=Halovenus halobia TaxID=3396622 RepID=UPI003F54D82F